MKTKKLQFVRDAIYDGKLVYKTGEIADVPVAEGYALRWEKRGIAFEMEQEVKTEEKQLNPYRTKGKNKNKTVDPIESEEQNAEETYSL